MSPGNSLAPDGTTVQYSEVYWNKNDNKVESSSWIHLQDVDTLIPYDGGFISWSLDSSEIVYGDKLMEISTGIISPIITAPTMVWIDNRRYLYMTEAYKNEKNNELFLSSIDGLQISIDQGVDNLDYDTNSFYLDGYAGWSLPFDFSD
jgi:hypothetical protein